MSKPKKTPEMRAKLLELRQSGLSLTKCYLAAGIGKKTVQDWRKEDPTFENELDSAWALFVKTQHDLIVEGAKADPKYAQWLLARLDPGDYSETQRTEVNIILEMPGLLKASTGRAQAWLSGAKAEDWAALDKRAAAGELTDVDYELLDPGGEKDED